MNRPTWNNFIGKNFDDNRYAMEALARLLFRTRYGLGDSLPYFKNHAGNETDPIEYKGEIIGFQSKFFDDGKIDADQIMHSLETVCKKYPNQNRYIIYTNSAFGNPKKGHDKPVGLERLESKAKANNLTLEWIFGENVLDLVQENELAYNIFFNPQSNLQHILQHVEEHNRVELNSINNSFVVGTNVVCFNKTANVNKITECINNNRNIVITGESGSGKSAVVKSYCKTIMNKTDYSLFFVNAGSFAVTSINDVFNLQENYTLGDFSSYFEGYAHKIIVVDSSEKLLELKNTSAFRLFTDHLKGKGWQFIFTCKDNVESDFQEWLSLGFQLDYESLKISNESDSNIKQIASDYDIQLPTDKKLLKELHIPFYFARYCELSANDGLNFEEFRNSVWKQKVCGTGTRAERTKREVCMLDIVNSQQVSGSFVIPYDQVDIDSASLLVDADILGDYPHHGYFVKHDIYTDWALDIKCANEFEKQIDLGTKLSTDNVSIQYLNAFKRWLLGGINARTQKCLEICEYLFDEEVTDRWRRAILECIGVSEDYASEWMQANKTKLKDNNYKHFNAFVDTLVVTCMYADQYFTYEGKDYPLMKPIGSGWQAAVEYAWTNVDEYYLNNLASVQKLVSNFSGFKKADNQTTHHAGMLTLRIFDVMAESRKNKEDFWFGGGESKWAEMVCRYGFAIKDEIKERLGQVISNKWTSHRDPYAELVEYIIKKENSMTLLPLCIVCQNELIALLEMFWTEAEDARNEDSYRIIGTDYSFGLNRDFIGSGEYFPCSAFQTPVYTMLNAENMLMSKQDNVFEFLIRFIDERVATYAKRGFANDRIKIIMISLRDGKQHEVIIAESLWNLYRGSSGLAMPHMMESIHMALEKFLLELADKEENKSKVDRFLWRILEQSHSCSLYAIVASVAMAHIKDYWEQLLFLMQDINFLTMDLMRHTREHYAGSLEYAYFRHKNLWNERKSSNALKHRNKHLEQVLFESQILLEHSTQQEQLYRLYDIVDNIKRQVSDMPKNEQALAKYTILRIDVRNMTQKEVEANGVKRIEYSPVLTPEMHAEQKSIADTNREMMKVIGLRHWIDSRFKGRNEDASKYSYNNKPEAVLETVREIRLQIGEQQNSFNLMSGNQYLPFTAAAVLLMQFRNVMTDAEVRECEGYLVEALEDIRFMLDFSLSGVDICLSAIPCLLLNQDLHEDVKKIIICYAQQKGEGINNRPCDTIYYVIKNGDLWCKYPELMEEIINEYKSEIGVEDISSIDKNQAESLLCLLTSRTNRRDLGQICMDKVSEFWKPLVNRRYQQIEGNLYITGLLSDYWLEYSCTDIPLLVSPFKPYINGDLRNDNFISSLVYHCAQYHKYDEFWTVWDELYEGMVNNTHFYYYSSVLSDYLLNPSTLVDNAGDWFEIRIQDISRFARIARDMGSHPSVLYSISKVFATIGRKFQIEILSVLNEFTSITIREFKDTIERNTIYYLEIIMDNVFPNYLNKRQTDNSITVYVENILCFMQNHGSAKASDLLKQI